VVGSAQHCWWGLADITRHVSDTHRTRRCLYVLSLRLIYTFIHLLTSIQPQGASHGEH
jgi:hypothetical protein